MPVHCVRTRGRQFTLSSAAASRAQGTAAREARASRCATREVRRRPLARGRLREEGIDKLVVVGLATDYCVKETAMDALRLGFATTVVREAVPPVDLQPGDGDRALQELEEAGADVV